MATSIAGDGHTLLGHVARLNLKQIFQHDIPKATGFADHEAAALRAGWEKLAPEVQAAILHGSGILDTIAADLNAAPTDIVNNILSKFTDITKEQLQGWLAKVQGIFTGVAALPDQDLETTVSNIQNYLKQFVGSDTKLGSIISTVAQVLASIINPTTLIGQITTYMETAYQIISALFPKK